MSFRNVALVSLGLLTLSACGGPQVRRNLETDPGLRVFLDASIETEHFVQIQRALVQSHKFEVVDRREGLAAALREQDLQFRSNQSDRFDDSERWAFIGKLYGAAAIITAHAECFQEQTFFWNKYVRTCKQTLFYIDGRTGVILFSVSGSNSVPWTASWAVPDWDDVVAKAVEEYPTYFQPRIVKAPLDQYMMQATEHSKRERERAAPAPTSTDTFSAHGDYGNAALSKMREAQANYLKGE
jgi:hypothetical protein